MIDLSGQGIERVPGAHPFYPFLRSTFKHPDQMGIALSGGGVRAACLGLGTLQVAEEVGLLSKTDYVSSVSGGSYISSAFIASRRGKADRPGGARPWSRGSPEEEHLKRHLRYLVEDWGDLIVAALRYLTSVITNTLPLVALIVLMASLFGLFASHLGLLVRNTRGITTGYAIPRWLIGSAVIVLAAVVESLTERSRGLKTTRRILTGLGIASFIPDVVRTVVITRSQRVQYVEVVLILLALSVMALITLTMVIRTQWSVVGRRSALIGRAAARITFGLCCAALIVVPLAYVIAGTVSSNRLAVLLTLTSAGVLIVFGLLPLGRLTSLARLYEERLDRAYIVSTPPTVPDFADRNWRRQHTKRLSDFALSDLASNDLPELVICAAVNLRERESAQGEGCSSFTFTPSTIGSFALPHPHFCPVAEVPGNERSGALRLSSITAISGAAVSPNMGRYTRRTARFALALLDLRLGRWMSNPISSPSRASTRPRRNVGGFDGPFAMAREAMGWLSVYDDWLFISDGGHWDNSGVVELLRRRCRLIFSLDAASDAKCLSNVLRMISLARSELGVDFEADASLLQIADPVIVLRFRYPDDPTDTPPGRLLLMRTLINDEMPPDLVALAQDSGAFPRDPTINQFFSARDSTAYVSLGRWLMTRAVQMGDLPPAITSDATQEWATAPLSPG